MSKTNDKKPFYKRGWFLTVAVLLCLYIIGLNENGSNKSDDVPYVIKRAENLNSEAIDNTKEDLPVEPNEIASNTNNETEEQTNNNENNDTSKDISSETIDESGKTQDNSNTDTSKDSTNVVTNDTTAVSESINYSTTTKVPAESEENKVIPYKSEVVKTNDSPKKTPEPAKDSAPIYSKEDDSVYIGKTGTKYHYKSCRTLKGNGIPISLAEAKAQGRSACKICH